MFDYKLLSALAAIVEQGGFERGAQQLGLSQSAISQRIKLLEARVGQPVLLRGTPPQPTDVGRRLLNHVQQVRLLEHDVHSAVPGLNEEGLPERLRIAINADSLATWWAPTIAGFCADHGVLIELLVEDQDVGLKRMQAGEVAACICATEKPIAGARSLRLGAMRYLALASRGFMARYFPEGVEAARLTQVPAIVFGPDDRLQHRYLAQVGADSAFSYHLCPSSEGFVQMALAGLGWGLMPELQVRENLRRGDLLELIPGCSLDIPLYWHYWRNGGSMLEQLTGHLSRGSRYHLLGLEPT